MMSNHYQSTDEYLNHVKPKNLLLAGYNRKTTRIWQCKSLEVIFKFKSIILKN